MENKYTSLEISRLIQNKVPEVGTEKWWIWTDKKNPQIISFSTVESERWRDKRHLLLDGSHSRAYRLDDVLTCIKVWGEKQGWQEKYCHSCNVWIPFGTECYCEDEDEQNLFTKVEQNCHRLLTAYLADNGFGERTEGVLQDIFNEK